MSSLTGRIWIHPDVILFTHIYYYRLGIHRTAPQQMRTRRRSSTAGSDIAFVAPVSSQLDDEIISGSA